MARARRDWNFVFVGSTHLDRSALDLATEPNVRLIGTKRYEEAQAIISHFDVALIPHLDNEMSRSMNPLKAYVYCSLGVPIVSSPVANLDQLAEFITFADGPTSSSARSNGRSSRIVVLRIATRCGRTPGTCGSSRCSA